MLEDDLKRCEKIPLSDISSYAELTVNIEVGSPFPDILEDLAKYGSSLKEIDLFFKAHLESCLICKGIYSVSLEYNKYFKSLDFLNRFLKSNGISDEQIKEEIKFRKAYCEFPMVHLAIGEDSEKLRAYIIFRYRHNIEPNPEYEQHIKDCDFCKEFDSLAGKSYEISRKVFDRLKK
jgi:hypothetical protein